MERRITESNLSNMVSAMAQYEIKRFENMALKDEYWSELVCIDHERNVFIKSYKTTLEAEEIKKDLEEKGIFLIGYINVYYDEWEERIRCSHDEIGLDLCEVARKLNTPNIKEIIKSLKEYAKSMDDANLVLRAMEYARIAHAGQTRLDGSPFVTHPFRVAENVHKYCNSDRKALLEAAACLHDTIEDTSVTFEDLEREFGTEIACIVRELTNDDAMKHRLGKSVYLANKMANMSDDALFIKLCDRLDNISDLENTKQEFRERYSRETLETIEKLLNLRKLNEVHLVVLKEILGRLSLLKDLNQEKNASIKHLSLEIKKMESNS